VAAAAAAVRLQTFVSASPADLLMVALDAPLQPCCCGCACCQAVHPLLEYPLLLLLLLQLLLLALEA
jgi:hypothetical protein